MPTFKTLLLALAALTTTATTTLAAPTTPLTPTPLSALSPRADFHPSPSTEDDYCGEAVPSYTFGPSAPLAADCAALYQANPGPGYWLVTAAETIAKDATSDRWTRLAASGTCAFEVRLSRENKEGVVDYRFGTNDVRFYIRAHASEGNAEDGRVAVKSGVWCRRVEGTQARVDWRVVLA